MMPIYGSLRLKKRRPNRWIYLGPAMSVVDHIIIAVEDLEKASADYALMLGRAPSWRGTHPDYGSANTLFRLDNC